MHQGADCSSADATGRVATAPEFLRVGERRWPTVGSSDENALEAPVAPVPSSLQPPFHAVGLGSFVPASAEPGELLRTSERRWPTAEPMRTVPTPVATETLFAFPPEEPPEEGPYPFHPIHLRPVVAPRPVKAASTAVTQEASPEPVEAPAAKPTQVVAEAKTKDSKKERWSVLYPVGFVVGLGVGVGINVAAWHFLSHFVAKGI